MSLELVCPKHLVIVRHGQSIRNVDRSRAKAAGELHYGAGYRDMDVPLTPRGEKQARAVGQYLASQFEFDAVYVSPFKRTQDTARLILAQFASAPDVILDERLREISFGILDGLTPLGIKTLHPEEAKRQDRLGKFYFRPIAGEDYNDVALRLRSFLRTLARECQRKSVLLVTHSVPVLIFRALFERLSADEVLAIDGDREQEVFECSVSHYEFASDRGKNGKLVLRSFAGVHYGPELATGRHCRKKAHAMRACLCGDSTAVEPDGGRYV